MHVCLFTSYFPRCTERARVYIRGRGEAHALQYSYQNLAHASSRSTDCSKQTVYALRVKFVCRNERYAYKSAGNLFSTA